MSALLLSGHVHCKPLPQLRARLRSLLLLHLVVAIVPLSLPAAALLVAGLNG